MAEQEHKDQSKNDGTTNLKTLVPPAVTTLSCQTSAAHKRGFGLLSEGLRPPLVGQPATMIIIIILAGRPATYERTGNPGRPQILLSFPLTASGSDGGMKRVTSHQIAGQPATRIAGQPATDGSSLTGKLGEPHCTPFIFGRRPSYKSPSACHC